MAESTSQIHSSAHVTKTQFTERELRLSQRSKSRGRLASASVVLVILGAVVALSSSHPEAFRIPSLLNLITHNFLKIHLLFQGRHLYIFTKIRRY
ncbi:rCG24437 [Rattus norvegicus]|uniref:RCG24437 n=1 Tax=Rattus norvegicus TaxID=10116 RepID=A6K594_RAT|nr:rCG24437 [Rattus norvegicus]